MDAQTFFSHFMPVNFLCRGGCLCVERIFLKEELGTNTDLKKDTAIKKNKFLLFLRYSFTKLQEDM